jgi:hypothetical protein
MRVRFNRAVREGICHAEEGMEWDTGADEGRSLLARGWVDVVKQEPPRHALAELDDFLRAVGDNEGVTLGRSSNAWRGSTPRP